MAYFGKRSQLSNRQLNRAAVALDLPCDPDTLRRLAGANQLIYRNSVRPTLGPDTYQVLSRSRGGKWYNVYHSIYEASWGCTCQDFSKRRQPCQHIISVLAYRQLANPAIDRAVDKQQLIETDDKDSYYSLWSPPPVTEIPSV